MVRNGASASVDFLELSIILDAPFTAGFLGRILNISMKKIDRVKKRFVEEGIDIALDKRKADRIYKKKTGGDFEAHIVALSCSDAPEGFGRWSLRLLADKAVELEYIDSISHEAIRRILKKTNSNLGSKKVG